MNVFSQDRLRLLCPPGFPAKQLTWTLQDVKHGPRGRMSRWDWLFRFRL